MNTAPSLPHAAPQRRRDLFRPLAWRVLAFITVFAMAIVGFSLGVGVTERDIAGASLAEHAYYALGLFVLAGIDLGVPEGGPTLGRALLWTAYFAAPLITVSALVETAIRLVNPLALRMRALSGHVILGGAGRLTLLYVRKLRERDPRRPIVIVDRDPNHRFARELRDVHRAIIVIGDVASDGVLGGLRIERAHRVLLLTGDDFANLDAASKILRLAPTLAHRIVVHVSDLGVIRETAGSSVARDCDVFNGHQFAAIHLVHERLIKHFLSTSHRDLVVLAGFGRFGQTVLDQLQQHALGRFGPVVIFDENLGANTRAFAEWPGFSDDYEHIILEGNLRDPDIWRHIGGIVRKHGHEPVVILASGNDDTNLHAALRVRRNHPGSYAIVRSLRTSPFLEEVAEEAGAHAINLGALIASGMPESWF